MEKPLIKASLRTVRGKQVGALRRQGKLPGVIYGSGIEATPIIMDLRDASRTLATTTASTLVSIDLDGKLHSVLVREKQRNYIRNTLLHVDFQAVSLTEKIRAKVGINLEGVSPAVKDFNGMVVTELNELDVEALPQDLPERFILNISTLQKIGDALYVRDIPISEAVQILNNPEEIVAVITAAGKEEEEAPVAEVAAAEEPEVIERGKKEEETEE